LPYTDLTPAEQVEAITTDLAAARDQLREARHQLLNGTSPHLAATMPMIAAMRQRADDLRPAAVTDANAHQEWIDADHTVEVAEHTAAQWAAELDAARTAGQDGRVDELEPLHALAADRVEDARSEATARRADYDTAHHTLVEQAGPTGITTPRDVEFARIAVTDLDLRALATHRDQVRVLEGALLRAETHAAREHALAQPALSTAPGVQEQRGVQARLTADTTTQGVRPGQRSASAELVHRVQLTQPDRAQPVQAAQPQDTAADPEASQTLGWRTGLGPRPEDPALARQWAFTTSMVDTYRSDYHITSTDPSAPLGAPPPPGSEQALAYHAVNREWKATTMTNAQDTPEADSDVQRRLADLDQRLSELTQYRDADTDLEDEVDEQDYEQDYQEEEGAVVQDGITDEHGFGYGTGYTDRHRGDGQGSHMGY